MNTQRQRTSYGAARQPYQKKSNNFMDANIYFGHSLLGDLDNQILLQNAMRQREATRRIQQRNQRYVEKKTANRGKTAGHGTRFKSQDYKQGMLPQRDRHQESTGLSQASVSKSSVPRCIDPFSQEQSEERKLSFKDTDKLIARLYKRGSPVPNRHAVEKEQDSLKKDSVQKSRGRNSNDSPPNMRGISSKKSLEVVKELLRKKRSPSKDRNKSPSLTKEKLLPRPAMIPRNMKRPLNKIKNDQKSERSQLNSRKSQRSSIQNLDLRKKKTHIKNDEYTSDGTTGSKAVSNNLLPPFKIKKGNMKK